MVTGLGVGLSFGPRLGALAVASLVVALACRGPRAVTEREADPIAQTAQTARSDRSSAELDPSPQACATCHPGEYQRWQGSLHAQAWDDPVFQAEYQSAPSTWCRDCHDPPSRMPNNSGHGIDCATCHLREGRILASATSPEAEAAHAIEVDPALTSSHRCARCHQFNYAADGIHDPGEALQDTLAEWQASDAAKAGQSCVSCHLRDHAFVGMSDADLLARAVEVELSPRRTETGLAVEVRVTGGEIGHAFPTGDVFRIARLTLRAGDGAAGEAHVDMKRWLGRTADPDGLDSHVRTLDDTRVPPPGQGSLEQLVEFELEGESAHALTSIAWTLELHRLSPHQARTRGLDEDITRVTVAQGTVEIPNE